MLKKVVGRRTLIGPCASSHDADVSNKANHHLTACSAHKALAALMIATATYAQRPLRSSMLCNMSRSKQANAWKTPSLPCTSQRLSSRLRTIYSNNSHTPSAWSFRFFPKKVHTGSDGKRSHRPQVNHVFTKFLVSQLLMHNSSLSVCRPLVHLFVCKAA